MANKCCFFLWERTIIQSTKQHKARLNSIQLPFGKFLGGTAHTFTRAAHSMNARSLQAIPCCKGDNKWMIMDGIQLGCCRLNNLHNYLLNYRYNKRENPQILKNSRLFWARSAIFQDNLIRSGFIPFNTRPLGMIPGCDSASCHCGNGKVSILKVPLGSAIPGLNTMLGEPDATHSDLKHAGKSYFFTV